ncbi:ATP-binding protein [Natronosalvus rutilus]|uniref:histidine kinase n=1 Tax=Natronosalvus rutilus TaxID=2953753 RepID=A0A9E7NC86_9EURY|nr:PAS domain-containing sensor histidine kinase [Natronosalvus rutilus]UTF55637.1 PAS domain-containing sensor histidine kinase [Natronosalvus rutilus]
MESEGARLPSIFNDLDVGIILYQPHTGKILDVNDYTERLFGYSAAQLRAIQVDEYTAPSTPFTQAEVVDFIQTAASGEHPYFEWQIERVNGEFRWTHVYLTETTIDGSQYVLGQINDITEYKSRENLLQLLTRIIRHNLRNDMSVLIGYAEQLQTAIEDDRLEEEVQTILDVATEVGNLSNSIKEIEQVTDPDVTKRYSRNLRRVARERVKTAQAAYPDCELTTDASADVWVTADEGLTYALDHAIRNAVEHNDCDTPKVTVTVDDDNVSGLGQIQIVDNGPPIPEMEIDAIDERIETSSTYHGSGVGLWVMKWCVDSLGGKLTFKERSPRGNIVCFSLPKTDQR